jgi:hypothetical protein
MNLFVKELFWQVVILLFLLGCVAALIYKFIGIYPEL